VYKAEEFRRNEYGGSDFLLYKGEKMFKKKQQLIIYVHSGFKNKQLSSLGL
jgi:hypothetical protein